MKLIKLKSYTIIEIIISMIVMSIIVFISYFLFFSLSKQFNEFSKTQDILLEYTLFKTTLRREFFKSKKVSFNNDNALSIYFDAKRVNYIIKNEYVLRKIDGNIDTLYVNIKKIKPSYIGFSQKGVISKLVLEMNFFGEKTFLFLEKNYGADVLINDFFEYESKY